MKRTLLFLLLALSAIPTLSQDTRHSPGSWSVGAHYHYGFMIAHRPSIIHLQQKHLQGFEVNWQKLPSDSGGWRNIYGFPWLGITYLSYDLGNPLELGRAHGLFPTIYFPLVRHKPTSLVLRFGWGVGYIQHPFNTETNYKNLAIGSHWNMGVTTAVLFRFPASARMQVTGGLNFTHFSNGTSQLPNLGLNMTAIQGGIQYYLGKPQTRTRVPVDVQRDGFEYTISGVAGVKDVYPPGGTKYVPVNISFNALKDFTSKSMFGFGSDLGYDESMEARLEPDDREGFESCVRVGVHGTYGLHVGKVYGMIQVGTYLYNPMTLDGTVYNRLAFRYYTTPRLYLAFGLKSHYAKADYMEWGIGYSFKR